jgi:uncharacterized protein (DUF697 family)
VPLFDITSGIKAQYRSGAMPADAYKIMKKIVVDFAKRGYSVSWTLEKPGERLEAMLTDKEGTKLKATIAIIDEGTTTLCDILIAGHVFLGGLLGRLVSASTIQGRAQEKIKEMLDESFAGQPSKRAPIAKPAAPKPVAPSTLPPGHPAAAKPAPAPAPAPSPAPAPPPAPAPAPSTSTSTSSPPLRAAAVALGAPALDVAVLTPLHVAVVQDVARARGRSLDNAAATGVLQRIGATAEGQGALASSSTLPDGWLKTAAVAYALTVAVGEAAARALADAPIADDALKDVFEASFERVLGEKTAAHRNGSALGDKLEQVREAYDADLITEAEMIALRERVLSAL